MTATKYLARALTVTLAAGALVTSAASCGAMNESRKDKEATSSSSSSAATPSTPAESASDSEADGSHGATEPDDKQSPTSSNGSDAGSPQGIPESAHAKLDHTPLTAEEMKKGQQLPQDLVLKLFEGEYEQACGMLVFAKNGDLLRADVPELKSLCAQELEENIQKGEISSMPKEKIMEDSDPKRFTLHDNGDGTATFERDGEVSGEKLVRLDDGSLRILIEGF